MWKRLSRAARAFAVVVLLGVGVIMAALATLVAGVVSSPRSRQTGRLIGYDSFALLATVLAIVGFVMMTAGQIGLFTSAAYRVEDDGTKVTLRKRRADVTLRTDAGRYKDWSRAKRRGFWTLQLSAIATVAGIGLLVGGLVGAKRDADSGRVITLWSPVVVSGIVVLSAAAALSVWSIGRYRSTSSPSIVVPTSPAQRMFTAFVVALVAVAAALAILSQYAIGRSIPGDGLSEAFISPPRGFAEVPPRGPEDGPQDEAQVAALFSPQADAVELLRSTKFVAGWSRHWTNGGLESDSLVIRVYQFGTSDDAHNFAIPEGCCTPQPSQTSTTVAAIADARVTSSFNPNLPRSYGYLALPYRTLGIGRVCDIVVTVFFRSKADLHTAAEVSDLLALESDAVRSLSRC